jgi:hypothetical protein
MDTTMSESLVVWESRTSRPWRNDRSAAKDFREQFNASMKAIEKKKLFESGDLNKFDVPLLCTLLLAMTLSEPLPQAIHDIREVRNSASHSDTYCLP